MARKVILRRNHIIIGDKKRVNDVAQLEHFVKAQLEKILKDHIDDLIDVAEMIEADAMILVPEDTGKLASSISVRISKSHRYPGIIAEATAHSRYKPGVGGYAGHDYAPYMEYGEDFEHEKETASAHFLGGPFALRISQLFEDLTGKPLRMPDNLQDAADYVEDKLK